MQSIVEVVCVGGGSNNTKQQYNSVYTDPGYCKMVIVQDDDKFPSPRLCLLRRWPNFEGGFGFNLYEDLISQSGALKVEEVVQTSPAEAGGLRKNDVIIEINGENIEFKSFFRLVEILKEACNQNEMELLVLAEGDADWYRIRNICVNSHFPNIEYCETPYYGHILKPLEAFVPCESGNGTLKGKNNGNSQIEFHSSTGKLYRTTLVIDKEKDSVYRRIEELPSNSAPCQSADMTVPPLRPDGGYRHPSAEPSVRVYYRRDRECLNAQMGKTDEINATADSGHGSIRRSTPLSNANTGAGLNGMSPYSTLGKSYGEQAAVDLLHDKWADLMDKYLDNRFRSSSAHGPATEEHEHVPNHRDASTGYTLGSKRNKYSIHLNDPNATIGSKKSRCHSPNDNSFSYLYSGRDDFQSASATSFREINRQSVSPYHHLAQQYQRAPQRYPSPHHTVTSPTRHYAQQQQQQRPHSQNKYTNVIPDVNTSASSSPIFQQYESTSSYHHSHKSSHETTRHSPSHGTLNSSRSESSSCRAPHSIVLRTQKSQINSLGFQLNESDIVEKGTYFVKYVEPGSASAMAGLKDGDKITKINGKSTAGMGYEQFCYEIVIAQQQQQKNNMIHLMVMRRSTKVNAHSVAATAASSVSNLSGNGTMGPTVLPIKNNYEPKSKQSILSTSTSSQLNDEGYVPDSMNSATSSAITNTANVSTNNLVSVVKVTSSDSDEVEREEKVGTHQSRPKTPPHKQTLNVATEEPGYVAYEPTVDVYKPNVIYDNGEPETLRFLSASEKIEALERNNQRERELAEKEQEDRMQREQKRLERERNERERREAEIQREAEREREHQAERERENEYRRQRELEKLEREKRQAEQREQREREEAREEELRRQEQDQLDQARLEEELRQKSEVASVSQRPEPHSVQTALTALTTITVIGSEPINADAYTVETKEKPEHINYQVYADEGVKPYEAHRYPLIIDEIATTTTTRQVNEIERTDSREEIVDQRPQPGRLQSEDEEDFQNNEFATTSQYLPDDLDEFQQEQHQKQQFVEELENQDEDDRARQQYAEQKFLTQQEVMKHLVVAVKNPELMKEMKTYNLYKSQHFFGYGIAFHTEDISISKPEHKLVYPLIEIESKSPADEAGMMNYQRVIAVNGEFVNKDFRSLEDLVQSIEESYYSRDFTEVTVLDSNLWEEFMENPELAARLANYKQLKSPSESKLYADRIIDSIISAEMPDHQQRPSVGSAKDQEQILPRLCRLTRQDRNDQYGFDFKTLKSDGMHVAKNVREGLPAHMAGLKEGDYILEVNGESIDGVEHESVVKKISAHPSMVDLLAVNDLNAYLAYRDYTKQPEEVDVGIRLNSDFNREDVTYHRLKPVPGFKGLGISLNNNAIISAVEPASPAEKAALKKDLKIVKVNGKNVTDKSYKEIGAIIREHEKDLVLGCIDMTPQRESVDLDQAEAIKAAMNQFLETPESEQHQPEVSVEVAGTQSVSSKTGEKISGKLSGSRSNLTSLKNKFGSCLGLKSAADKESDHENQPPFDIDALNGARTCNLVNRPDFDGFGFSMRCNDKGPHQISNVELESPAHYSGLKSEDYVLRVNDVDVVGERYNKTVALIKNESEKGRLKLEVIEPHLTPYEIRNVALSSNYGTLSSNKGTLSKKDKKKKDQSIDNLRQIANDVIGSGSMRMNDEDRSRAVSLDASDSRKQRPFSMSDIDRVPHNSTVRSNTSYGSTATAFSEMHTNHLATNSSKSVTDLSSGLAKPKFKRCFVHLLPDFKGYGFTLNSKVKPKYSIYTIDTDSPAYKANLRETDVIVQIDKKNIRRQKFDKVKTLLSDSQKKGQVEILAIDREGYMYYKNRKKRFSSNKLVTNENVEGFSTIDADGRLSTSELNQEAPSSTFEPAASRESIGDMLMRAANQEDEAINAEVSQQQQQPGNQNGVTSASSSRVQLAPLDVVTGTELDNQELLKFTVVRETGKPLGLALSQSVNKSNSTRSLSRSSSKSGSKSKSKKSKKSSTLPIITSVEEGSPADASGLRPHDLVIEINGKATSGETNKKVGEWIKGSGNTIEFLVSREKKLNDTEVEAEININANNAEIRENARLAAEEAMNATRDQLAEDAELQQNPQRMSRKDSAQLSQRSKENSRPTTPKVINSEIRMSSSRLHQEGVDDVVTQVPAGSGGNNFEAMSVASKSPSSSSYRSNRNHSEPAAIQQQQEHSASFHDIHNAGQQQNPTTVTPLSNRSRSSMNISRDAPVPRLCRVRAFEEEEQLGFTVSGSKTTMGIFKVNDVTPNSPAAHSGLLNGDFIIEISGRPVESMGYGDVVSFIKEKKGQDDLQLLVADSHTLNWYKQKKIQISSQIVPQMQYIETLRKKDLMAEAVVNPDQTCTSTKLFKIPNQLDGQAVTISRKIHLSNQPLENEWN